MINASNSTSDSISSSVIPDSGSSITKVEAQIIRIQSQLTTIQNTIDAMGTAFATVTLTATNATLGSAAITTLNVTENASVSKKLSVLGTDGLYVQYGIQAGFLELSGELKDKNGSSGLNGQILYSTETGIVWGNIGDIVTVTELEVLSTSFLHGNVTIGESGIPASITHYGTSTHTGSVNITGDVTITGNITQNGSSYVTHAQEVYTTNDYIIMRDGATGGLATGSYSGMRVKLYDGTNDGILAIDNTGTARVGDSGAEQPLATRSEATAMVNGGLVMWYASGVKLVSAGDAGSTSVPIYLNNGVPQICAVDTVVTTDSTHLITSGAVKTADNTLQTNIDTVNSSAVHKTGDEQIAGTKDFTGVIRSKEYWVSKAIATATFSKTAGTDLYIKICTIPVYYCGEISLFLGGNSVVNRYDLSILQSLASENQQRAINVKYTKYSSSQGFSIFYLKNGTNYGNVTIYAKFEGTITGDYTCNIYEHKHDGECAAITPYLTVVTDASFDSYILMDGYQGEIVPANIKAVDTDSSIYTIFHQGNVGSGWSTALGQAIDTAPVSGSTKGITSGAVYSALAGGFTGYVAGSGNGIPYSHNKITIAELFTSLSASLPTIGDWCPVSGSYIYTNQSTSTQEYTVLVSYAIRIDSSTIQIRGVKYTNSSANFHIYTVDMVTDFDADENTGYLSW